MTQRCEYCDYEARVGYNWDRHLTTKKHKTNELAAISKSNNKVIIKSNSKDSIKSDSSDNSYKCKTCNATFVYKKNLKRHEASTCKINFEHQQNMIDMEVQKRVHEIINTLEKKQLAQEKDQLMRELKEKDELIAYLKESQKMSATTINESVSALTFLTKHFKKTPEVKQLTTDTAKNLLMYEKRLSEYLLYHNDKKTLDRYIGDIVVKYIKKEDPEDQSVWNSDVSRLTYLIRELVNDEHKWITDSNGIKFTEYVITPIVNYVEQYMTEYLNVVSHRETHTVDEQDDKIYTQRRILMLFKTIKKRTFKKDVLEHIAPYVSFKSNYINVV